MILYWWTCPWCFDRMATKHTEAEVIIDRDAHIKARHEGVVVMGPHLVAISHYRFHDAICPHPSTPRQLRRGGFAIPTEKGEQPWL